MKLLKDIGHQKDNMTIHGLFETMCIEDMLSRNWEEPARQKYH